MSRPSLPTDNRVAVAWFESTDEGRNTAIAILDIAANTRRIVAGTERGEYPSWSPDGSTIAYVRNDYRADAREIRLMDASSDANNHAIATKGDNKSVVVSPAWSPNGKQIAFFVRDLFSGATTVWVIDRDGADVHEIADVGQFDLVTWRPDGAALLLGSSGGAAVIDLATREVSVVSEDAGAAIWSGDGNQILYYRPLNSGSKHRLATGTIEGCRRWNGPAEPSSVEMHRLSG